MNAEVTDIQAEKPAIDFESKARSMGWVPKERWRGPQESWQDAESYVKRGEQLLPFLKSQTATLESQLAAEREARARIENDLKGAQEAIDTLQSFKSEVKERIDTADESALARQLAEAREAGDTLKEIQLMRTLAARDEPKSEAKATPAPKPIPRFEETPEGRTFVQNHPWWESDPIMKSAALGVGQKLAAEGKLNGLTPIQRAELIASETLSWAGRAQPSSAPSRVEGGRSSEAAAPGEGEHSLADLPPDAREAMKRQAKFLVGPGRRFKTEAEWQKHYLASYFRDWGRP
jgi:hypothetical protein